MVFKNWVLGRIFGNKGRKQQKVGGNCTVSNFII
jgi:hypothetical protein